MQSLSDVMVWTRLFATASKSQDGRAVKHQPSKKEGPPMKELSVISIDISKSVFQLHGEGAGREFLLKKRLQRGQMKDFFVNRKPCTIVMEACGGSHYWARELEGYGHKVKLLPGERVKSYVVGNKNDVIDAAAISEAYHSPRVQFAGVNSIEQQDLQMKHRIRARLVRNRTSIVNECHGFLLEYGVIIPLSVKNIVRNVISALEEAGDKVSAEGRRIFSLLCQEVQEVEGRIQGIDEELKQLAQSNDRARRLCTIPGVGPIIATAVIAAVGDPHLFKNGRQFAAWLGLVPGQDSTGGRTRLGRITKRGDRYIRSLLVQGAQSCAMSLRRYKEEPLPARAAWIKGLISRRGWAKAVVATANKNARIVWAILSSEDAVYNASFTHVA